jgi:phosphoglycolate phosphatase
MPLIDDRENLHSLLSITEGILLDFDGPVCAVFAGFPAPVVANQLRSMLADNGQPDIPYDIMKSEDPFDVLNYSSRLGDDTAKYVEVALRAHEVEATATANPTPGGIDLMKSWRRSGRKLAIVSNNSSAAVESYLGRMRILDQVDFISGREDADPAHLKPATYLLDKAMNALGVPSQGCLFVGDSISDIEAARSAKMNSVGFANKAGKAQAFQDVGATAIVTDMRLLVKYVPHI